MRNFKFRFSRERFVGLSIGFLVASLHFASAPDAAAQLPGQHTISVKQISGPARPTNETGEPVFSSRDYLLLWL